MQSCRKILCNYNYSSPPSYKATASAGLRLPYKAGGLCRRDTCSCGPTVNAQRMWPHMPGGLWRGVLIRGGLLYYNNICFSDKFVCYNIFRNIHWKVLDFLSCQSVWTLVTNNILVVWSVIMSLSVDVVLFFAGLVSGHSNSDKQGRCTRLRCQNSIRGES